MTQSETPRDELTALAALGWIAGQEGLLEAFLNASGLDVAGLKARAGEREVMAQVLDFLLERDEWVLGFARDQGLRPEEVQRARASLPGGDVPHWT